MIKGDIQINIVAGIIPKRNIIYKKENADHSDIKTSYVFKIFPYMQYKGPNNNPHSALEIEKELEF